MADLTIKPQAGTGNKLIIQDQAGNARITTSDAGIDIPAVTGNLTVAGDLVPATPLSNRNMIINGGMQVWQRGLTTTGASTYRQDRFKIERRASTTPAVDRSTDIPTGEGFAYSARMYATAGTDDGFHFYTTVELPGTGRYGVFKTGTKMILSFWIKSAYSSRTVNPVMNLKDSLTGSNSSTALNSTEGSTTIPTSWTRMTFNYTMPSWTADTGSLANVKCASLRFLMGSDNTPQDIYITGVQLELGSNATPFEHRSYGDEFIRCERYFCSSFEDHITPVGTPASAFNNKHLYFHIYPYTGAHFAGIQVNYKTKMRTSPSVTFWTGRGSPSADSGRVAYWEGSWASNNGFSVDTTGSGPFGFNLGGTISSSTRLCQFNFTADAEL